MKYRFISICLLQSVFPILMQAQQPDAISFSGSFQTDLLFPEEDNSIGTGKYDDDCLSNTYLDLNLLSKYVDAGARIEYMRAPLPGYEADFKGQGLPYLYVKGKYKGLELTAGDFYEQFGSGLILRTYEERSLGIDNSIRGGRLVINSIKGIDFRVLGGSQRHYWRQSDGYVYGGDLQINLEQYAARLRNNNYYLMIGASYVGKYQKSEDIFIDPSVSGNILNLPEKVGSFDVRVRMQKDNFSFLAEYALKTNDPSADNLYIYKNGSALLLSGSYSKKGMSILLQAKRSDNMMFRSERGMTGSGLTINHLPAFAFQHTYALPALYPYATQPDGEWAFQGEFRYTFKRNTALGGKYGTDIQLNASHIRSIDRKYVDGSLIGTDGYSSKFFKMGDELYYQDINLNVSKKLSSSLKLNVMYMFQKYNQEVVEGHGINGKMVNSHILLGDAKYRINNRLTVRAELQYLHTKQAEGDWIYGLAEVSVLPYLTFSVSDMYNSGSTDVHYYMGMVTFNYKASRLMAGYGRTRAGFNCSGGVCRWVPANKGFQLSYLLTF